MSQQFTFDWSSLDQKSLSNVRVAELDPDISDLDDIVCNSGDMQILDASQPGFFSLDDSQAGLNDGFTGRISKCSGERTRHSKESAAQDNASNPEELSYPSDGDTWSILDQIQLASPPDASPASSQLGAVQSGARYQPTPVQQTNKRSSPFQIDSGRSKRWSTGIFAAIPFPSGSQHDQPYQTRDQFSFYGSQAGYTNAKQARATQSASSSSLQNQNMSDSYSSRLQPIRSSEQAPQYMIPRPLPSQQPFGVERSKAKGSTSCSTHFKDHCDPPDLHSSLHEQPSDPPDSDMHPAEPDLLPHEQDLRFSGDLYTPRWVRGHGNKREGWCGLCKPGRWLVLKNSAFWYDKSFAHGVSHATGVAFQGPQETRRQQGNIDVWEGLCGTCGEWIALVSSKKKGTTWFRHAYKCHPHQRVNAVPKRHKETDPQLHTRTGSTASTASSMHTITSSTHTAATDSGTDTANRSSGDCISGPSSKLERVPMSRLPPTPRNTSTPLSTVGTIYSKVVDV